MFSRSPGPRNRPGLHIGEHLFIDPLCSTAEGKFTQGVEISLVEELLDRPCCHIRDIDFPVPQPLEKFRGCKIDNLDLCCFIDHPVGNRLAHEHTGDLGNNIIETLDVLDIQRGIDIDTGIEQFLDILVAFGVTGTGNIGMGEFIDKNERWPETKGCIEVKLREHDSPVLHHLPGNEGKPFEQCFGLRPAVGLDIPGSAHQHLRHAGGVLP